MNSYIFTKCPSCGGQMRFNRPETPRFVVVCPTCKYLFDAEIAQFEKDLVPATLIKPSGEGDKVLQNSSQQPQNSSQQPVSLKRPASGAKQHVQSIPDSARGPVPQIPVVEQLNLEEYLPPLSLTPVRPINSNQPDQATAHRIRAKRPQSARRKQFWSAPIVTGLALLAIFGTGAVALLVSPDLRASLGIGRYREFALLDRYATALNECHRLMVDFPQGSAVPTSLLNDNLKELEQLLVDCVRMKTIPESRHVELRAEMQKLFESQMKLKESSFRIVPNLTGDQRLQFAKLAALVSLIELRLSFGLREVPIGSNEIDAYSRKGILLLRDLDHTLLSAREVGLERQLDKIASILDALDNLAVQRVNSGELRGNMAFDYRLMAKASEGWHQWCLNDSEAELASQVMRRAIDQERTSTWDRYQLALTAIELPIRQIAALDRIREKIRLNGPDVATGGLLAAGDSPSTPQSSVTGTTLDENGRQSSQNQASLSLASATPSGGKSSDSVSSFRNVPQPESNASGTRSMIEFSDVASKVSPTPNRSTVAGSVASPLGNSTEPDSNQSVENSSFSTAQNVAPDTTLFDLDFLPAQHVGPNSLCVKVQSTRPDHIKEQAFSLGNRLKVQPHFQAKGNLITITFSPFRGSMSEAARLLEFGTIEIVDSQSRTLFVVDQ